MDSLISLCIFIIILFLYIHIANQYKLGEELEIYETDYDDAKHLESVCELKQPVLVYVQNVFPSLFSDIVPETVAKYGSHDVNIKDCHDYFTENPSSVDPIILPLNNSIEFIENDQQHHLFSENNQDFLDETGILLKMKKIEHCIQPPLSITSKYDLMFGSKNTCTPLRYHNNNRKFLCVTNGKVKIKMSPWKSCKFLHPYKDYENYEFRSLINPKRPQSQYALDFEKTNFIEFLVHPGFMLYIPPFWWYSIQYLDDPSTFICSFTYSSLINHVSNIKDLSLYFLQQQNITKKVEHQNEFILPKTTDTSIPDEQNEIIEQTEHQEVPIEEVKKEESNETEIKKEENSTNEIKEPEPTTSEIIEEPPKTKKIKTKKQINKDENISYSISDI